MSRPPEKSDIDGELVDRVRRASEAVDAKARLDPQLVMATIRAELPGWRVGIDATTGRFTQFVATHPIGWLSVTGRSSDEVVARSRLVRARFG